MPKAFICGCAGLTLNAEERAFLRREDPWGLILFKRNVADRDQVRRADALVPGMRRPRRRARADRSGGRPGPANGAASLARISCRGCDRGGARAIQSRRPRRVLSPASSPPISTRSGSPSTARLCSTSRMQGTHAAIGTRAFSLGPSASRRWAGRSPKDCSPAASRPSSSTCPGMAGRAWTAITSCPSSTPRAASSSAISRRSRRSRTCRWR